MDNVIVNFACLAYITIFLLIQQSTPWPRELDPCVEHSQLVVERHERAMYVAQLRLNLARQWDAIANWITIGGGIITVLCLAHSFALETWSLVVTTTVSIVIQAASRSWYFWKL